MVNKEFADKYQLDQVVCKHKSVRVADSRSVPISHEAVSFSVKMGNIQISLGGPIMKNLSHDVIAGMD